MDDCSCDGEKLCFKHKAAYWRENGTLNISPQATPNRRNHKPSTVHVPMNSWEKGVAKDSRGMPLLKANLAPIGVKEYGQRRHEIEAQRRGMANGTPTPAPPNP